jgi:hypothetical protein
MSVFIIVPDLYQLQLWWHIQRDWIFRAGAPCAPEPWNPCIARWDMSRSLQPKQADTVIGIVIEVGMKGHYFSVSDSRASYKFRFCLHTPMFSPRLDKTMKKLKVAAIRFSQSTRIMENLAVNPWRRSPRLILSLSLSLSLMNTIDA